MKFYRLKKRLSIILIGTLSILSAFPASAYYAPGATLDPTCSPGTSGCDISPVASVSSGGTGLTSFSAGDLLYGSSNNTLAKLAIGASGKVLKVSGGTLSWEDDNVGPSYLAGTGLSLASSTFSLDINGLSSLSSIAQDDYIPIYDSSTGLNGKISRNDFLAPVLGSLNYQGSWDASASSTPAVCDSGSKGHYYVASVAGNGYSLNDWSICNGTSWDKLTSTSAVASVFGRTGIITASAGDYNASQITNTPAGNISSTNVQNALNELDTKKLSNVLNSGLLFIGNASSTATAVALSGDATLSNLGVLTINNSAITSSKIADDTITNSDISSSTAIDWSKISKVNSNTPAGNISATTIQNAINELDTEKLSNVLNSGLLFIGNASSTATAVALSGDATLSNLGVLTINNSAITSSKIADDTITNSDISSSTAIDWTKINKTNSKITDLDVPSYAGNSGKMLVVNGSSNGVTWASALTTSLAPGSMFIGNASSTATAAVLSGDATLSDSGVLNINNSAITSSKIADDTITNSDISSSTAIDWSKISKVNSNTPAGNISATTIQDAINELDTEKLSKSLSNGYIFVGNGSDTATGVAVSGDIAISNTGVTTIQNNAITSAKIADDTITNSDISSSTAIDWSKINKTGSKLSDFDAPSYSGNSGKVLAINAGATGLEWVNSLTNSLAPGKILIGNGSGIAAPVTLSGDIAIDNSGVVTIGADTVALGTDTTGNYVAGVTANGGLVLTGTEAATLGIQLDGSSLALSSSGIKLNTANANTWTAVQTFASPVINTGVSGTAIDTDGTLAANSDTKLASQKAIKTYVDNNVNGLAWRAAISLLDTTDTTKPATTATQIDGQTVADGNRVLFTNLSSGNNEVYTAGVSGSAITWTLATDGQAGNGLPTDGDTVYVKAGTANGSKNYTYNGSSWVLASSLSGALLASNNLSEISNAATARHNLGLGATDTPIFAGLTITGAITASTTNAINGLAINSGNLSGVSGITFLAGSGNFDMSASSGTFKTGTGAVSINGDTTIAAGKNISAASGTTNIDMSASTGTTKTGTGAVSLNGNTTVAAGKTLTLADMTAGSILFAGTSGVTSQDNANIYWDATNHRLGIGTTSPSAGLTNALSTVYTATSVANLASGGAIGTASTTVDVSTTFNINQTTSGQTLTLPDPSITTAGRIAYISNVGSASFTMYGATVSAGKGLTLQWSGSNWTPLNATPAGSAVALSSLVAATAGNTIDNLNNAQIWNWSTATTQTPLTIAANALTTGSGLSLTTSSNNLNSANGLLYVANTSSSTSGILARFQANATSTSGLTILANGNVGIGTTNPGAELDVVGGNIDLDNTTFANQNGLITKNGLSFISDFNYGNNGTVTTNGGNTFIGFNVGNMTMGSTAALAKEASNNTVVGNSALLNNTTGYQNSILGYNVLNSNTTGYQNSVLGSNVLNSNTTGYQNSALGLYALNYNTTGFQNVAVGFSAGRFIADGVTSNQTSRDSLYLGASTRAMADGDINETVIGYGATGNGSNTITLGDKGISGVYTSGSIYQNGSLYQTVSGPAVSGGNLSSPLHYLQGFYWDGSASQKDSWSIQNILGTGNNPTSTLAFAHSGSSGQAQLVIPSGINVGIGTSTPSQKLHLSTAQGTTVGLQIQQINRGNYKLYVPADSYDFAINDVRVGLDRVYIDSGGNVGIGTTAPSEKLDVKGNIRLLVNENSAGLIGKDSGDNNLFSLTRQSNDLSITSFDAIGFAANQTNGPSTAYSMYIDNGNVGIGTTNPVYKLDVVNSGTEAARFLNSTANTENRIWVGQSSAIGRSGAIGFTDNSDGTSGFLHLVVYGDTTGQGLIIKKGGNVGIGTANPEAKLELLNNAAGVNNLIQLTNTYHSTNQMQGSAISFKGYYKNALISAFQNPQSVTGGDLQLQTYSDDNVLTTGIYLNRLGNVGIGTTNPGHLITLAGGAYSDGATWSNSSDRNAKENFIELDGSKILEGIAGLDISQWNYKSEKSNIKHVGPMAQDFYAAFGLNNSDTSISTIDSEGIALAGIQELYKDVKNIKTQLASGGISLNTLNELAISGALSVEGHVALGADTVGEASLDAYVTSTKVMFTDKYTEKPAITMTPEAQISGTYWISDIEPDSFTINLSEPQDTNVNFSWHAFARKGVFFPAPASSANVQPVAETQPTPDNTAATSTDSSQIIPEASSTPLVETATPETPAETTAPTATPEASVSETAPDTSSPTN